LKNMNNPEIIIKNSQIIEAISSLPNQGPWAEELLKNDNQSIIISRLITSEEIGKKAELHENYTDILFIQEGQEEIFIGGEITDKLSIGPGEWRGENLINFRTHKVEKGDIMIIPKGVAHRHGKGKVKILVIKVA